MIPYAIEAGDIRPYHVVLLERVKFVVSQLPNGLTCHEVCEAVAREIPELTHHRGFFRRRGIRHSWLVPEGEDVLIDAYPRAAASGPLLVTTAGLFNPWKPLYISESARYASPIGPGRDPGATDEGTDAEGCRGGEGGQPK